MSAVSRSVSIARPSFSRCGRNRSATLPERRQSRYAWKLRVERVALESSREKIKHCAERRTHNETFVLVPSFFQGHHLDRYVALGSPDGKDRRKLKCNSNLQKLRAVG